MMTVLADFLCLNRYPGPTELFLAAEAVTWLVVLFWYLRTKKAERAFTDKTSDEYKRFIAWRKTILWTVLGFSLSANYYYKRHIAPDDRKEREELERIEEKREKLLGEADALIERAHGEIAEDLLKKAAAAQLQGERETAKRCLRAILDQFSQTPAAPQARRILTEAEHPVPEAFPR